MLATTDNRFTPKLALRMHLVANARRECALACIH
jgi:hypothetical protein